MRDVFEFFFIFTHLSFFSIQVFSTDFGIRRTPDVTEAHLPSSF